MATRVFQPVLSDKKIAFRAFPASIFYTLCFEKRQNTRVGVTLMRISLNASRVKNSLHLVARSRENVTGYHPEVSGYYV